MVRTDVGLRFPRHSSVVKIKMIQTQFLAGQGLGNQLWVYAAGRGIAEHLARPHVVLGYDDFKGHEIVDIDWGEHADVDTQQVSVYREETFYDPELGYFASDFDANVVSVEPRCRIVGNLQSEQYFFGRVSNLSSWMRPIDSIKDLAEQFSNRVIINVRGGEYKRHKNLILPKEYWEHAINHLRIQTGVTSPLIVTDDPSYAKVLFPDFEIVTGIRESWAALYGARAIAVSNSSFSYFPIKVRKTAPLVIAPMHWARFNNLYGRWASPANYYEDWLWLNARGELAHPDDCVMSVDKTRRHYQNYSVRVPSNFTFKRSLASKVPTWLKKPIKSVLKATFPGIF